MPLTSRHSFLDSQKIPKGLLQHSKIVSKNGTDKSEVGTSVSSTHLALVLSGQYLFVAVLVDLAAHKSTSIQLYSELQQAIAVS
jgi:hypothetical protein